MCRRVLHSSDGIAEQSVDVPVPEVVQELLSERHVDDQIVDVTVPQGLTESKTKDNIAEAIRLVSHSM